MNIRYEDDVVLDVNKKWLKLSIEKIERTLAMSEAWQEYTFDVIVRHHMILPDLDLVEAKMGVDLMSALRRAHYLADVLATAYNTKCARVNELQRENDKQSEQLESIYDHEGYIMESALYPNTICYDTSRLIRDDDGNVVGFRL